MPQIRIRSIGSNQTELNTSHARILFSYETPVAAYVLGEGWFRTEEFHSVTTSKHINKWLDGRDAEKKPQSFFDELANL